MFWKPMIDSFYSGITLVLFFLNLAHENSGHSGDFWTWFCEEWRDILRILVLLKSFSWFQLWLIFSTNILFETLLKLFFIQTSVVQEITLLEHTAESHQRFVCLRMILRFMCGFEHRSTSSIIGIFIVRIFFKQDWIYLSLNQLGCISTHHERLSPPVYTEQNGSHVIQSCTLIIR